MTLFGCVWTSRHLQEGVGGCQRMNQDEIAELKRQFAEHASWGFVSRYGRTGRILSVRADRALTFEDLTPGTLVTVDGATGTEENYDAGDIEVVPEGEGGFDIAPATGTGPRLMPVFP